MIDPRVFPSILIALNMASAIVCAISGDYRKMTYWLAAAILNFTVTW